MQIAAETKQKIETECKRLKQYFPYRIIWGAANPENQEYVTGANVTMRQANDYVRKGWHVFVMQK